VKWSRASARGSSRQSRAAQRRSILNPLDKFSIDGHMSEAPERWLEKLHAPQHRECEILKNSSLSCADITPESGTRAVDEQCRKKRAIPFPRRSKILRHRPWASSAEPLKLTVHTHACCPKSFDAAQSRFMLPPQPSPRLPQASVRSSL
jgi:hypothetical protein